jgi:hypothetical protein
MSSIAGPSGYVLGTLREGSDFTVYCGRQQGSASNAEQPSPQSLRSLEHEHSLAGELDPVWAAKPLAPTRHQGRTILLRKDPGGEPLDLVLERDQGQPRDLTRCPRIAIGFYANVGRWLTSKRYLGKRRWEVGTAPEIAFVRLRLSGKARIVPWPRRAQDAPPDRRQTHLREKNTGRYAKNIAIVVRRARYPGVLMETNGFGRDLNVPTRDHTCRIPAPNESGLLQIFWALELSVQSTAET